MPFAVSYEVTVRDKHVEEKAQGLQAILSIVDESGQGLGKGIMARPAGIAGDGFEQCQGVLGVGLLEVFAQPLLPELEDRTGLN